MQNILLNLFHCLKNKYLNKINLNIRDKFNLKKISIKIFKINPIIIKLNNFHI